jgi:hypothetical protein
MIPEATAWGIAYWILVLLVLTNGISFIWGRHAGRNEK